MPFRWADETLGRLDRVALAVALAGLGLAGLLTTAARAGEPAAFDVQGHRGCRGLRPENTLPAFEKAIDLGVTTLELDLQVTRDGALVVYHDKRLDPRLCEREDGSKPDRSPFAELDLADLTGIDCGSRPDRGFPERVPVPGAGIPQLEEVLALARDADYPVRVSIEIKQDTAALPVPLAELADRLAALTAEYGLVERTAIQSGRREVLAVFRERAPDFERALLVRLGSFRASVADGTVQVVSMADYRLRRKHVARVRASGARLVPWTVNRPKRLRRLVEWGVDGVITDYPDRALSILREVRGPGRTETQAQGDRGPRGRGVTSPCSTTTTVDSGTSIQ